jgi:membrane protease YdiL (CAAX protease family)
MQILRFYHPPFSTKRYFKDVLSAFVLLYALWLILSAVHSQWHHVSDFNPQTPPDIRLWLVLLSPAWEEFLFRGLLLPLIIRRTTVAWGIALQAFLFAGLHSWDLGSIEFQWAFLSGVFLGVLTWRKQSWGVAFGVHWGINLVSVIVF